MEFSWVAGTRLWDRDAAERKQFLAPSPFRPNYENRLKGSYPNPADTRQLSPRYTTTFHLSSIKIISASFLET